MVRVKYLFGSHHTRNLKNILKQRGKYPEVMKDVINISDIILQVLDSRYIEDTRNLEIEEMISDAGKKIVYVLNKADLVDIKKIKKKELRNLNPHVFISTVTKEGAKDLRDRIKIEASKIKLGEAIDAPLGVPQGTEKGGNKSKGIRKKVHVGIIGYPNVGKSSLINLIVRRGVAKRSKQAGHTKGMQKVKFTDKILILDTPGVIPESRYSSDSKSEFSVDARLGARTYSDVKDPEDVVYNLLEDVKARDRILRFYGLSEVDSEDFVEELGRERKLLLKGGKVDIDRAARIVLRDWQEGKIR